MDVWTVIPIDYETPGSNDVTMATQPSYLSNDNDPSGGSSPLFLVDGKSKYLESISEEDERNGEGGDGKDDVDFSKQRQAVNLNQTDHSISEISATTPSYSNLNSSSEGTDWIVGANRPELGSSASTVSQFSREEEVDSNKVLVRDRLDNIQCKLEELDLTSQQIHRQIQVSVGIYPRLNAMCVCVCVYNSVVCPFVIRAVKVVLSSCWLIIFITV